MPEAAQLAGPGQALGEAAPAPQLPTLSVVASAPASGSSHRDEKPTSGVSLPRAKAPGPKGQARGGTATGLLVSLRLSHPEAMRVQEERGLGLWEGGFPTWPTLAYWGLWLPICTLQ